MPKKKTQEEFLDNLREVHDETITTEDRYAGDKIKITFHCNLCGHSWKSTPHSVLRSKKCPRCAGKEHRTQERFLYDLKAVHDSNIYTEDTFISTKSEMNFRCSLCGYSWYAKPEHILVGHGCPRCSSSLGEQVVSSILEFNNIEYDPQHNFKIRGKIHRLDFVLKDKNNNWCVIQPDGEQHFRLKTAFGGSKEFEHRKQMDRDENRYLPALRVRVLRIPYFWFDLDNTFILLKEFLGYDLKKPDKNYTPKYKRVKEMIYEYLWVGDARKIANRYGVGISTLRRKFNSYFGMSRNDYVKLYPEYNTNAIQSIDREGKVHIYSSQTSASAQTGINISNINVCINKHGKTAGGYTWEKISN